MLKALVLTISDRASRGVYEDKSGPAIEQVLRDLNLEIEISRKIISDDPQEIKSALGDYGAYDFIFTSGGTGIGPRDNTPEVMSAFCDKLIPGIAEYMRAKSMEQTHHAVFSRALAGIKGRCIIINLPGSERGSRFCMETISPLLNHAHSMISGGGH